MIYDVIVIGGGACGLACAYAARKRGKTFLILERDKKVGSKILVTGNGKCNLSATDVSPEKYNDPAFVKDVLNEDVSGFFSGIGIMTRTMDKRIYPYSESALTVANKLRSALPIDSIKNVEVNDISFKNGIYTVEGFRSKKVVLCTGSAATKGKGSYDLAKKFGHNADEIRPSLVPLITDTTYIKGLSGLRAKVRLKLLSDQTSVAEEEGELLFKDNGVSGICAMCLSAFIARKPGKYDLSVDFVPGIEKNIARFCEKNDIDGILHQSIAQAIKKYAKEERVSLPDALADFRIKNVFCGPITQAQVACGGLKTSDFDNNLQSRLSPGLYAGGEVLDVDGECGGYNLHWAFASGLRIGKSV